MHNGDTIEDIATGGLAKAQEEDGLKLSERLAAIAAMVPSGMTLADIGTDHAYLPIVLALEGKIPRAIAGDVHEGPYKAALDAVRSQGLSECIQVRFGDGLAVLQPGEAAVIAIAGMGGSTIVEILSSRTEILKAASRLVLQPMTAAGTVRRWLSANGWHLSKEELVLEDGRLYEIMAAEQGESPEYETALWEIGPLLWTDRHPLLHLHISQLREKTTRILAEMSGSSKALHTAKYRELELFLKNLEEKQACL